MEKVIKILKNKTKMTKNVYWFYTSKLFEFFSIPNQTKNGWKLFLRVKLMSTWIQNTFSFVIMIGFWLFESIKWESINSKEKIIDYFLFDVARRIFLFGFFTTYETIARLSWIKWFEWTIEQFEWKKLEIEIVKWKEKKYIHVRKKTISKMSENLFNFLKLVGSSKFQSFSNRFVLNFTVVYPPASEASERSKLA